MLHRTVPERLLGLRIWDMACANMFMYSARSSPLGAQLLSRRVAWARDTSQNPMQDPPRCLHQGVSVSRARTRIRRAESHMSHIFCLTASHRSVGGWPLGGVPVARVAGVLSCVSATAWVFNTSRIAARRPRPRASGRWTHAGLVGRCTVVHRTVRTIVTRPRYSSVLSRRGLCNSHIKFHWPI